MFNGQNIKRLSEIRGIKVKTICDTTGIFLHDIVGEGQSNGR